MRDSRGLIYSTALHGIILFLLIVGLPSFLQPPPDTEPPAITVDLLPPSALSNVKPEDIAPKAPVQQEAQDIKERVEVKAKPEKETPPPPPPTPPKPIHVVKPPPPQKKPPKPKTPDDLASILEGIKTDAAKAGPKTVKTTTDPGKKVAKSPHYDPGAPLSLNEKDAIKQQIEINWNAPVGAKNASNLLVTIRIEVARDGTVTGKTFTGSQSRYASDSFFRAAVDSAMRAVERSSPLKNLPPEKYNVRDGWNEIDIVFDPRDLP